MGWCKRLRWIKIVCRSCRSGLLKIIGNTHMKKYKRSGLIKINCPPASSWNSFSSPATLGVARIPPWGGPGESLPLKRASPGDRAEAMIVVVGTRINGCCTIWTEGIKRTWHLIVIQEKATPSMTCNGFHEKNQKLTNGCRTCWSCSNKKNIKIVNRNATITKHTCPVSQKLDTSWTSNWTSRCPAYVQFVSSFINWTQTGHKLDLFL